MNHLCYVLLLTAVAAILPIQSATFHNLPVVVGFCNNPKVTPHFKPEQFFNKKWYVWKSLGQFLFRRDGSCAGTDSKIKGKDVELLHFQYEPLLQKYLTVRGDANADYIKLQGLTFPVNYNLFGQSNYTVGFAILGTDYANWAAVYLCHQLVGVKLELSWLLTADRHFTPTSDQQEEISAAIGSVGFDLDHYRFQDNSGCDNHEPHL